MKYMIKLGLFLLFWLASVCYAVDCYGGAIELAKDCIALGGCSWLGSDGLGSVHTKLRSYQCKDGSEYMLKCAEAQSSSFFGSYYEEYAACSDVSKKEYLVKVGAKQTKYNPEEERIARKKAKEEYERETKKANQYLLAQKADMNKAKQAGKKNREKTKKGILVDSRDGKTYKTVQIGKQNWMAENLNYDYKLNGKSYGSVCSEKDDSKCTKYGRLYNVVAATDSAGIIGEDNHACFHGDSVFCPQGSSGRVIQGICPDGWHLPTESDWNVLFSMLTVKDSSEREYGKNFSQLKSSDAEWDSVVTKFHKNEFFPEYSWTTYHELFYGTDDYGFSALKSGVYEGEYYLNYSGDYTDFWKYMKNGTESGVLRSYSFDSQTYKVIRARKAWLPLRCIENDDLVSKKIAENRNRIENMKRERARYIKKNGGSFVDERDGYEYRTIRIGGLNWMAENLRYSRVCYNSVCPEGEKCDHIVECSIGNRKNVNSRENYNQNFENRFIRDVQEMAAQNKKNEVLIQKCIESNGNDCPNSREKGADERETEIKVEPEYFGEKYTLKEAFSFASDGSVCPAGWHLPSTAEWKSLQIAVGDPKKLFSSRNPSYKFGNTDDFGFSILGGNNFWSSDYLPLEKMSETELYEWIRKNGPKMIGVGGRVSNVYLDGLSGIDNNRNYSYVRCVQGSSETEKIMARATAVADSLTKIRNKYIYENGGTFIDKRDGREYRGIQIGDRIWMAENLKFENNKSSAHEPHLGLNSACLKDGRGCYYQWMLAQGRGLPGLAVEACPSGWRLPDTSDVNALYRTVGGSKKAAKSLKQNGSWSKNGPDLYGFSLERMPYPKDPGENYGPYALWKDGVPFWTSTEVKKRLSYVADDLVWTMFFEDNGDAAFVKTSPKGAYLPIRCVAKSEKKSGIVWYDGELSHKDRLLNVKQEDGKMQDASEKKEDETRKRLNEKKVKHGSHIAFLSGFPLMEGQPGKSRGINKINSLIEGEVGYRVSFYWIILGLNLGVTYMDYTDNDEKQNFSYYYLGIPVSVRYPFTELLYVSGGVTYKRMLEFLGYPSYSRYVAMDGNVFLFSVGAGIMIGHWDLGLVLGTEYLGDEKSNRGENYRNRFLNIGINADCWF